MNEDRLLHDLGHLANEEKMADHSRLDERWDRMAAGTLTAEEEAELRALAETSPEAREAFAAFQPLGPDFQARITKAIAAELTQSPAEPQTQKTPFRVLPFRKATFRFAGWLTTAAAAAASLFLLLRTPALPPLPVYAAAQPEGGVQGYRSSTNPPMFTPGSTLRLLVRPKSGVKGPVAARAFLARGAEIISWEPEPSIAISDQGGVQVKGTIPEEVPTRVWVVVGRPKELPSTEDLLASLRAGQTRNDHWQAVYADLRDEDRGPP